MVERLPADQDEWDGRSDWDRQAFFWVETADLADAVIIVVGGAVDIRTADRFAGAVKSALARGTGLVIIDLSRAEFFAAVGVHVLDTARSLARGSGQILRMVVDEQGLLVRMLEAAGLTGSWKLFHDLGSALAAGTDRPGEVVRFG